MPRLRTNVTVMVIIGLVVLLSVTGCSSTTVKPAKDLSVQQIHETICQTIDLSKMKSSDATKLKKLYEINSDELEGFILYTAPSNLKADELLLIKLKSDTDLLAIKAKIAKRVDKQSTAFKDYLPEEHFLIQKHIIRTSGSFVLLVISKDAEKVARVFDQILK